MDGDFLGLAGLLLGISLGLCPLEIPRSSPARLFGSLLDWALFRTFQHFRALLKPEMLVLRYSQQWSASELCMMKSAQHSLTL